MHGKILNEISKDMLSVSEESFELDKITLLKVLAETFQGLTPYQMQARIGCRFATLVQTLLACEKSNLVSRMPDTRWWITKWGKLSLRLYEAQKNDHSHTRKLAENEA